MPKPQFHLPGGPGNDDQRNRDIRVTVLIVLAMVAVAAVGAWCGGVITRP